MQARSLPVKTLIYHGLSCRFLGFKQGSFLKKFKSSLVQFIVEPACTDFEHKTQIILI